MSGKKQKMLRRQAKLMTEHCTGSVTKEFKKAYKNPETRKQINNFENKIAGKVHEGSLQKNT